MTGEPIKVLCADDHPDLSLLLEKRIGIETDMCSVGRVHDLQHLVREAQRTGPDVVVLDLTMLGRDALEFIPSVQDVCPQARVIIYSGYDHAVPIERARAAGAWGYVSKAAELATLVDAIRDVAAGRRCFPSG